MNKRNQIVKQYAKKKGVYLWELGEKYGMTDNAFSRRLRTEFTENEMKEAMKLIDQIAADRSCTNGSFETIATRR